MGTRRGGMSVAGLVHRSRAAVLERFLHCELWRAQCTIRHTRVCHLPVHRGGAGTQSTPPAGTRMGG